MSLFFGNPNHQITPWIESLMEEAIWKTQQPSIQFNSDQLNDLRIKLRSSSSTNCTHVNTTPIGLKPRMVQIISRGQQQRLRQQSGQNTTIGTTSRITNDDDSFWNRPTATATTTTTRMASTTSATSSLPQQPQQHEDYLSLPYLVISDGEYSIRVYLSQQCQEELITSYGIDSYSMHCSVGSLIVVQHYRIIAIRRPPPSQYRQSSVEGEQYIVQSNSCFPYPDFFLCLFLQGGGRGGSNNNSFSNNGGTGSTTGRSSSSCCIVPKGGQGSGFRIVRSVMESLETRRILFSLGTNLAIVQQRLEHYHLQQQQNRMEKNNTTNASNNNNNNNNRSDTTTAITNTSLSSTYPTVRKFVDNTGTLIKVIQEDGTIVRLGQLTPELTDTWEGLDLLDWMEEKVYYDQAMERGEYPIKPLRQEPQLPSILPLSSSSSDDDDDELQQKQQRRQTNSSSLLQEEEENEEDDKDELPSSSSRRRQQQQQSLLHPRHGQPMIRLGNIRDVISNLDRADELEELYALAELARDSEDMIQQMEYQTPPQEELDFSSKTTTTTNTTTKENNNNNKDDNDEQVTNIHNEEKEDEKEDEHLFTAQSTTNKNKKNAPPTTPMIDSQPQLSQAPAATFPDEDDDDNDDDDDLIETEDDDDDDDESTIPGISTLLATQEESDDDDDDDDQVVATTQELLTSPPLTVAGYSSKVRRKIDFRKDKDHREDDDKTGRTGTEQQSQNKNAAAKPTPIRTTPPSPQFYDIEICSAPSSPSVLSQDTRQSRLVGHQVATTGANNVGENGDDDDETTEIPEKNEQASAIEVGKNNENKHEASEFLEQHDEPAATQETLTKNYAASPTKNNKRQRSGHSSSDEENDTPSKKRPKQKSSRVFTRISSLLQNILQAVKGSTATSNSGLTTTPTSQQQQPQQQQQQPQDQGESATSSPAYYRPPRPHWLPLTQRIVGPGGVKDWFAGYSRSPKEASNNSKPSSSLGGDDDCQGTSIWSEI